MEWIKCSERLPDRHKLVLIYDLYEGRDTTLLTANDKGHIRWGSKYHLTYDNVTHWMPLPEEPEHDL